VNSSARNDIESPILRLPGELRNKVYRYVFGNMIIETSTAYEATIHRHNYLVARDGFRGKRTPDLYRMGGILFTCRKLYAEARLLPLQLSITRIQSAFDGRLQVRLQAPQLNAIRTICVSYDTLMQDGIGPVLHPFKGLKRVIVDKCCSRTWLTKKARNGLAATVKKEANNADIEVLFVASGAAVQNFLK